MKKSNINSVRFEIVCPIWSFNLGRSLLGIKQRQLKTDFTEVVDNSLNSNSRNIKPIPMKKKE